MILEFWATATLILFLMIQKARKTKMKNKIKEVVQQVAEAQDLTIVEVLNKYPDLKLLLYKEEIEEKKKVIKEDKQLLKGWLSERI